MDIQELKIQIDNIDETLNQYIIAAFTDEYYIDRFNNDAKEKLMDKLDKALEIRVFGEKKCPDLMILKRQKNMWYALILMDVPWIP